MARLPKQSWPLWLVLGAILGLIVGGMWPDTPLHAVATDRTDTFAMATGFVDEQVEAVYFLDFLTGTLRAAVLSNQSRGFQAYYEANVTADLRNVIGMRNANLQQSNAQRRKQNLPPLPEIQVPQSPNYLMVSGTVDIRRGAAARMRPAASVLYVAETTTGVLLAYIIPWDQAAHAGDQILRQPLTLWAGEQVAIPIISTP